MRPVYLFLICIVFFLAGAVTGQLTTRAEAAPQFSIICRDDVMMTRFTLVQKGVNTFDYQSNFPEGLSNGTCTVWPKF